MENDYPEKFGVREHYRYLCQSFARAYFFSRQRLIEVLISEGLARTMINELAFEIAINECKHLFILDKYDSYCSRADGMLPKKRKSTESVSIHGEVSRIVRSLLLLCKNWRQVKFTLFAKLHITNRLSQPAIEAGRRQIFFPQQQSSP